MTFSKRTTIEDVFGDFGFRVRWDVLDHWADVKVYEIASHEVDEVEAPRFALVGWRALPGDDTPDIEKAEIHLEGFVKWDGCSEFSFSGHFCGPVHYKRHIALIEYLYHRAFELMGRSELDNDRWADAKFPDPRKVEAP